VRSSFAMESLRAQVRHIEGRHRRATAVLPFGLAMVDSCLPGGGLAHGALHEVGGGGNGAIDGAAAALFVAGIAARTRGKVLWCVTRADLFAPALSQSGLKADRVIYLEGGDEKTVLACFEEGLRHGGLGAAVAELARLPMTASRRLQLAADHRHRPAALASADGSLGFRPADRRYDALARLGAAVDSAPRSRRWPAALAGRADPLSRRRKCGF
jgi:protein ImuA